MAIKTIIYITPTEAAALQSGQAIILGGKTITVSDIDKYDVRVKFVPTDVQINGTSIVSDGVANIPIATATDAGVVKVAPDTSDMGIKIVSGMLQTVPANDSRLQAKTSSYTVVTPANLDKAIREGLGNNSLEWSDAYKLSARTTIGTGVRITDTTDPQGDVEMVDMETMDLVESVIASSTHNEIATAKAVYDAIAAAKPMIIYH